jgi:hypothetical protein
MPAGRKSKKHHTLVGIQNELAQIKVRIDELNQEGINVDQVNAALQDLSTKVDALIAAKAPQGGITTAEAQSITDSITAIATKVVAGTPAAA